MREKDSLQIQGNTYLHITSAAKVMHISPTTVRQGCRKSGLTCKQVGGAWYIEKASMRPFLSALQAKRGSKSGTLHVARKAEAASIQKKRKHARRLFMVGNEIGKSKR